MQIRECREKVSAGIRRGKASPRLGPLAGSRRCRCPPRKWMFARARGGPLESCSGCRGCLIRESYERVVSRYVPRSRFPLSRPSCHAILSLRVHFALLFLLPFSLCVSLARTHSCVYVCVHARATCVHAYTDAKERKKEREEDDGSRSGSA